MKKHIKYIALCSAITTAFAADNTKTITVSRVSTASAFTGVYAGVIVGYVQNKLKSKIDDIKAKKQKKICGFSYGILGGYGQQLQNVYIGTEFAIESDTTSKKKNYDYPVVVPATYKKGTVFSFGPRLGYVFSNAYMVYLKPTVEFSKDQGKAIDADGNTLKSKKKIKIRFAPAIGVEKSFGKVLARLEYSHNFGSTIKTPDDEGIIHNHTFKADAVKLGFVYKF
jgi:hypothetical protein